LIETDAQLARVIYYGGTQTIQFTDRCPEDHV